MGPGAVLIAYIIGGITIYGVMQSFGELLVNIPRRGSFVSYASEFMGDTAATGIAWAYWFNWVAYVPSEALAAGVFMNYFIKLPFANPAWSTFVWGIIVLALLTLVNVCQVTWFGHIESILAMIKNSCNYCICNLRNWNLVRLDRWRSSSVHSRRRTHRDQGHTRRDRHCIFKTIPGRRPGHYHLHDLDTGKFPGFGNRRIICC